MDERTLDEMRRVVALERAVQWGASFKNSTPTDTTIVSAAKTFEAYLKDGR